MIAPSFIVLHGGNAVELTLLEYLSRVLLHLLAIGVIAVLAFWWSGVVEAVRSAFSVERGGETDDR